MRSIGAPLEPDKLLWRYMTIEKFVAMLVDRGVYFGRLDKLGDAWEGLYWRQLSEAADAEGIDGFDLFDAYGRITPHRTYASCWHANDDEDLAMWKIYADRGIAIRTSVRQISHAVDQRSRDLHFDVLLDEMRYQDGHQGDVFTAAVESNPILIKRPCFKFENEVRAHITLASPEDVGRALSGTFDAGRTPPGIVVRLDLSTLIDAVIISPSYPQRIQRLVVSLLEKYRVRVDDVRHSDLLAGSPWPDPNAPEALWKDRG